MALLFRVFGDFGSSRWLTFWCVLLPFLCGLVWSPSTCAQGDSRVDDWWQGGGAQGDFVAPTSSSVTPPTEWSVVANHNILWSKTLPETGQSTVVQSGDRIYFTTLKEVHQDAQLGQDLVAWCCSATTGETLWTREIPGDYPLRLSGCFGDSSAPPAVCDGSRVCFFNASGRVTCFDLDGKLLWSRDVMPVARTQPFLHGGSVHFIQQSYMPNEDGQFTHEHLDAPHEQWTQLVAIDMKTGKQRWKSDCGVNMGCVPVPQRLSDGHLVIGVGRGGGHAPPERPEGVSLIRGDDGRTLWTLPLDGFMSTMSFHVHEQSLLVFHDDEHLWVDVANGKIVRQKSFLDRVTVRVREDDGNWSDQIQTLPKPKKKRAIIQQSNLVVGKYHYFRSYSKPYLGRVDLNSGEVQYLQLPLQLKRKPSTLDRELLWDWRDMASSLVERLKSEARRRPEELPINQWAFRPNTMRNSRGFEVMGDPRSRGTGWGHHASAIPTVVGEYMYVPIMNGTVYVIDWAADNLDERAIVAVNDLGAAGESFNRAGLSYGNNRIYAHTLQKLVCIQDGN